MKAPKLALPLSLSAGIACCSQSCSGVKTFANRAEFRHHPCTKQSAPTSCRKRRCFEVSIRNGQSSRSDLCRGINTSRNTLAFCHHPPFAAVPPKRIKAPTTLSMSLIPIPINELTEIIPVPNRLAPTGDQYVTYLGRTPSERFNTLFEGFSIAFLGSMFAYFISFVIGDFLATLLGIIFLFWPILSPEFKAYQRNWELVGGRDLVDVWMKDEGIFRGIPKDKRGLYGAYYVTKIQDICVVDDVLAPAEEEYDLKDFKGYKREKDELEAITGIPWKLRLKLMDEENRGMQIHCRMSEEYLDVQSGMDMIGVLLSTSTEFTELAGMSDFCVLDEEGPVAWVGDYPYLAKDTFLRTLDSNGVLDTIYKEGNDFEDDTEESKALSRPG